MKQEDLREATQLIARDFELEAPQEQFSEEELFDLLCDVIAEMIEHRLEFLLSLMYRLDVNEQKVDAALSPSSPEPANAALARLVLERQKQRIFTKRYYKQSKPDDLGGLEL